MFHPTVPLWCSVLTGRLFSCVPPGLKNMVSFRSHQTQHQLTKHFQTRLDLAWISTTRSQPAYAFAQPRRTRRGWLNSRRLSRATRGWVTTWVFDSYGEFGFARGKLAFDFFYTRFWLAYIPARWRLFKGRCIGFWRTEWLAGQSFYLFFGQIGPTLASLGFLLERFQWETMLGRRTNGRKPPPVCAFCEYLRDREIINLRGRMAADLRVFGAPPVCYFVLGESSRNSFSSFCYTVYSSSLNKQFLLSVSLLLLPSSRNRPFRHPCHYLWWPRMTLTASI